jgi:hypothetical protein
MRNDLRLRTSLPLKVPTATNYCQHSENNITEWSWPCVRKFNSIIAGERCSMMYSKNLCKKCKHIDSLKSFRERIVKIRKGQEEKRNKKEMVENVMDRVCKHSRVKGKPKDAKCPIGISHFKSRDCEYKEKRLRPNGHHFSCCTHRLR